MSPVRHILQCARHTRKRLALAATFSALCKVFDIFPEILIGIAVDIIVNKKTSFLASFGVVDSMHQLYVLGVLTIVIWSCESLTEYASTLFWRTGAQEIQHTLRTRAYRHIQYMASTYFSQERTGNIVSILNDDINVIEQFFQFGAHALVHLVVGTLIIGGIFFYIAPLICLLTLIPVPFVFLISSAFQSRLAEHYGMMRSKAGNIASHISNNIHGIMTIKSYVTEEQEAAVISQKSEQYKEAAAHAINVSAAFNPLVRLVIASGYIATTILGGYYALRGHISLASYTVLAFQTQRFLWPFTQISYIADHFERVMASARRIVNLLARPTQRLTGSTHLDDVRGNINFHNVSFSYQANAEPVLDNITLSLQAGHTIAFVGATGSGKSTIVNLLLRLYDPSSGYITLDGTPLHEIDPASLRKNISLVAQTPFLFTGTIKHNITYGRPSASYEEMVEAAKAAEAHEFIKNLPNGYDTRVTEQGTTFSGGEKQRIALARALLKDAPIFIFDEATSAIDSATEQAIQRSIESITDDHTTLLIAHRLTTVQNADVIHVLENGTIVESGSHRELLQHGGSYARLWQAHQAAS